jgi:hypothetical protein
MDGAGPVWQCVSRLPGFCSPVSAKGVAGHLCSGNAFFRAVREADTYAHWLLRIFLQHHRTQKTKKQPIKKLKIMLDVLW